MRRWISSLAIGTMFTGGVFAAENPGTKDLAYHFDEERFFYPLNIEVGVFLAGPVPIIQMHAENDVSALKKYYSAPASDNLAMRSLIAQATSAGDIDGFLREFMAPVPAKNSHYLLAHRSRSLQEASASRPRVILFDHENSWTFSFTHPENRNGHLLEFMQFNPRTRQFEFQSVDFSKKPPTVSEVNPPRCLRCHSGGTYLDSKDWKQSRSGKIFQAFGPRPNWDAGFIWRGFLGGRNDNNFWINDLTTAIEGDGAFTPLSMTQDHEWLREFFNGGMTGNRYSALKPLVTDRGDYYHTRNSTYNLSVIFRNAERVAHGLTRLENYPQMRKPIRDILCRENLENDTALASDYDLTDWPQDYQPLASGLMRRGGLKASLELANLLQKSGYLKNEAFEILRLMTTSFRFSETNGVFAFYAMPGADQTFSSRWLLSPIDGNSQQFLNLFTVTCQILNVIDPI